VRGLLAAAAVIGGTLGASAQGASGAAPQAPPRPQPTPMVGALWERTYRSPVSEYELKGLTAAPDSAWLLIGVRPKGQLGGAQKLELWRVDSRGERAASADLSAVVSSTDAQEHLTDCRGIAALPDGRAAAIYQGSGGIAYVVFDAAGKVAVNRWVQPALLDAFVTRVRSTAAGVMAMGRRGGSGWLMKLRATGELAAQITTSDAAVIDDAIETPEGYLAVAPVVKAVSAEVRVLKFDARGEAAGVLVLPGVLPSAVRDSRSSVIVTRQVNAGKGRQVAVAGVSSDMKADWSFTLPETVSGRYRTDVAPIGGDVLLAGEGAFATAAVRRVRRTGEVAWAATVGDPSSKLTTFWNAALSPWGGDVLVGLTLTSVEPIKDTFEQRQIVRIARVGGRE
jgi:hypothetical protein